MNSSPRLTQDRRVLLGILVFCAFETVESWRAMDSPAPTTFDLAAILVGTFVGITCILVAIRTSFVGDRVVIGPLSIVSFLWVAIRLVHPDQHIVHALRAIVWLMWVTSLFGSFYVLFTNRQWNRGPVPDPRSTTSHS
jgi:hypothetical protein